MAAPNIVNVADIKGRTVTLDLSTTAATVLVSNAASSNKVFKLNNIFVSNINGTSAADVTVTYHTAASGGGTAFRIASTVSVPADSTLVVLDKSGAIYLEENTSISVTAGTAGFLQVVASYEDIS
jgi:hypothetical protein